MPLQVKTVGNVHQIYETTTSEVLESYITDNFSKTRVKEIAKEYNKNPSFYWLRHYKKLLMSARGWLARHPDDTNAKARIEELSQKIEEVESGGS